MRALASRAPLARRLSTTRARLVSPLTYTFNQRRSVIQQQQPRRPIAFQPSRSIENIAARRHYASDSGALSKTSLHDLHVLNGGKMVPFAGYSMPVQYSDLSVSDSHKWTREKASLFDVGHMVQHKFSGPGAAKLLLQITPASLDGLKPRHSTLSCLLKPKTGGIIDDTVITRLGPEEFYVVTNAACREADFAFIQEQIEVHGIKDLNWECLYGWDLVALQGPLSAEILGQSLANLEGFDIKTLYFGQCAWVQIKLLSGSSSQAVLVSRGGYTGEDGFEISIPPHQAIEVTEALLKTGGSDRLRWAGLGARDSLRLEAGMCLYGHDLDDTITPVEAGLTWVVGKDRRETGNFNGAETILQQIKPKKEGGSGVSKRRIGLIIEGALNTHPSK